MQLCCASQSILIIMVASTLCATLFMTLPITLCLPPVEIIESVLSNYHRGCVSLLYPLTPDFQGTSIAVVMNKELSKHQIEARAIEINNFEHLEKEINCHCLNPPLYVCLTADISVQRVLERLSYRKALWNSSWLLFMDTNIEMKNFFRDIYIPMNCKFLVVQFNNGHYIMTEVYQIAKGYPLETFQYGLWTQETGIALSSLSLYERRNNLNGFVFNASGITEPPLTVVKAINGTLEVRGFFGEVWKILETHLHFKTHLEEAQDNAYGSLDNGTWSGVIDMLINKEVEMGLGEFRVTSERLEVIDYTLPIILSRYQIYIREPTSQNMMWGNFLEPFSSELWLTVVASIVIFSIFCAIIFYANHQLFYRNESDMEELTIWDAIHIVFGAFCQQGYVIIPRSNSCRMVLLCVYIIGAVLLAAYSAALVSFLAKRKPILPFNNLEELVTDGTYKFGLLQKSAEFNVFYGSKDKLLNETFNRFIKPEKDNLPTSSQEGLTRTCQSKFAFFVSQDIAQGLLHKIPCKIIELPGDSFKGSVSMALIKNSPYRELINHYLLVLRKGGVLGRLRNNIWPKHFPDSTSTWITVDLHDVTPLLTVLAAGILVSFLLLLLEQIFYFAINDSQFSPFPWTL